MIWLSILSGAMAMVFCAYAGPLGRALGVIDAPDGERKLHSRETPLIGGLAVIIPTLLASLALAFKTDFLPFYLALTVAAGAVLGLGLIDDRSHIRPLWRLGLSTLICLILIQFVPALKVTFLYFSFLGVVIVLDPFWAFAFTVICLVGLQNAINMADGKNGLVLGLSLIWVLLLAAYAPDHLRTLLAVLAVAIAVTLGFNLTGRVFLGDSGSYALSITIGVLAIYSYKVGFDSLHADVVALWFLVPVVDCLRLMVTRMIKGRSPFSSDRNHLHHMLLSMMRWRLALLCYLGLVAVPALLALIYPAQTLWLGMAVFSTYVVIIAMQGRGLAQRGLTAL